MCFSRLLMSRISQISTGKLRSKFTPRLKTRPSPHVAEAVYDALMDTLNPTLSLTNQEVQLELNRIAEQSKAKLTVKPAELADFGLVRQVANEATR
jgi:hypothetical protein